MRPPRTRYAKSGDLSIAYQISGDGPIDIVRIPGFVSHLDLHWDNPSYAASMRRLVSFARVICFDKRGTGLSDRPGGVPTLEERMDDIRAVMDAAGSERAALFGVSEGGALALLFTATYPDRTSALVLHGAFARTEPRPDFEERMDFVERYWGSGQVLPNFLARLDPDFAARYERSAATPTTAVGLLRRNAEIDVTAVLHAIHVPTLLIHNRGDPIIPVARAHELADAIDGARLLVNDQDTHGPASDAASDAMIDEIEHFLTGVRHAYEPDRVLATVMFTDIVSSTERVAAQGDAQWRQQLDRHSDHARRLIEQYRGRHVKSTGDGLLATFDGPARAIRCGVALAARAETDGMSVRAGVHTGEVELMDEDIGGLAVHIAKRVESSAAPGEVWVSQTVRDLVAGSNIAFSPMGERELKGVPGEWRLYRVDSD